MVKNPGAIFSFVHGFPILSPQIKLSGLGFYFFLGGWFPLFFIKNGNALEKARVYIGRFKDKSLLF